MCADIIAFAGQLSFEQFLKKTQKLSDMESYPQLTQRAQRVGYSIAKVVYRGYTASSQLQVCCRQCYLLVKSVNETCDHVGAVA